MRPLITTRRHATTTLFLALLLAPLPAHSAATPSSSSSPSKKCYFPNGAENTDSVPCDPDAAVSMCCGSRAQCLSSGLCLQDGTGPSQGIDFARGTCTDQNWDSPVCPQQCRINQDSATDPSAYDFQQNGVQVWECVGEGYAEPGAYCCESAAEKTRCCRTKTAVFSMPGATLGNALAVQTFSAPPDTTTASTTKKQESSPTSSSGETTGAEGLKMTSGEGLEGAPSHATATAGIWAGNGVDGPVMTGRYNNTGPDSPEGATSGGSGLSDAGKIGMGVGIGVGVTLLLAAAILAWLWVRARTAAAAVAAAAAETDAAAATPWTRHELSQDTTYKPEELDGHGAWKWGSGVPAPEELSGDQPPVEMWSGGVSWIPSSATR